MSKQKRLLKKQQKELEKNNLSSVGNGSQPVDKSPIVYQKSKVKYPLSIIKRELTEKQKLFLEKALDKSTKMMFVSGPAGTSKTYLAVLVALMLLNEKKVSDIMYVRSIVESADAKMGTLPGEKDEKLSPYIQPLMDKLDELLPKNDIKYLTDENRIDGLPIGYLRGLSWNAKVIIGDEFQNCTHKEIVTFITRVGEFSKVFILGDPEQSDLRGTSGFKPLFDLFNDEESKAQGIYTFEFGEEDIVRSALVKFIVSKLKTLKKAK